MKKFQVWVNITLVGDGWVRAANKKEAIKKYTDFISGETQGLSVGDIHVTEIISEKSKNYDKSMEPNDKEFDDTFSDCITHEYLS